MSEQPRRHPMMPSGNNWNWNGQRQSNSPRPHGTPPPYYYYPPPPFWTYAHPAHPYAAVPPSFANFRAGPSDLANFRAGNGQQQKSLAESMAGQPGGGSRTQTQPCKKQSRSVASSYNLDPICHPTGVLCQSKKEAADLLRGTYDGYYEHKTSILGNGTDKLKGGEKCHKYNCRFSDNANCKWRGQIREFPDGQFAVYRHDLFHKHSHPIETKPVSPKDQHGLHPTLNSLVEQYCGREGICVLRVKPMGLISHICRLFRKKEQYATVKYLVTNHKFFVHTKEQIISNLKLRKTKFVRERLGGISCINGVDTLARVLTNFELRLPPGYKPRSDFESAEALATALDLASDEMIVYNLAAGNLTDMFLSVGVNNTPASQHECRTRLEYAFCFFSCHGLYQLLTLATRRDGTRLLNGDGTGGLCRWSSVVIFGCNSVKLRGNDTVTSSLRPICYVHAGGERLYPNLLTLYVLRMFCWKLFRIELTLDYGESDHADAFVSAYNKFKNGPCLCDGAYRLDGEIVLLSKEQAQAMTTTKDENLAKKRRTTSSVFMHLSQNSVINVSQEHGVPTPVMSSVSAICGSTCKQVNKKNRTCSCVLTESCLQCAFHVLQAFAKGDSYVGKFKNKSLVKIEKKGKNITYVGVAYHHVNLIRKSRTTEQRNTLTRLVLQHWRVDLKETAAADHFEEQYCVFPFHNWNVCATDEPGVYPTGNTNEVLNRILKSDFTDLCKNASLATFLVWNAPKMLEQDVSLRGDACTIEIPRRPSKMMVAVTGFLCFQTDFRVEDDFTYANIGGNIGHEFTDDRLSRAKYAYAGDDSRFQRQGTNETFIAPAFRMGVTTNGICRLRLDQNGVWIGNCDSCMTQLGYECPAAIFLRSRSRDFSGARQLVTTLEELRKVKANARGDVAKALNRGVPNYFSGLSRKRKKNRETVPSLSTLEDYLQSLRLDQLLNVVEYMRLVHSEEGYKTAEEMTQAELMYACKCFISNPSTYRMNQKKRKQNLQAEGL